MDVHGGTSDPISDRGNVDPATVTFDTLTFGEAALIEELTGWGFNAIVDGFDTNHDSPAFVLARVLIAGARADDTFTIDDAASMRVVDHIR